MSRQSKPWKRKGRAGYWAQIGGRQVQLVKDGSYADAVRVMYQLLAGAQVRPSGKPLTVAQTCGLYLEHSQKVNKPNTYKTKRSRLQAAVDAFGSVKVRDLRPARVEQWLADRGRSSATRRGLLVTLRAALAWCRREGRILEPDCLAQVKTPKSVRRQRTLTPEERSALLAAADPDFRDFLDALTESGARPHVIADLEARHIDWGQREATVVSKSKAYRLVVTDRLATILKARIERFPTGPLFRSRHGRPWGHVRLQRKFARLGKRLGIQGVTAYTYRHSFATDAIERGVRIPELQMLLNHDDPRTTMGYVHLAERRTALRQAAEKAARAGRGEE